ncbi:MAG: PQQ-binding-like beta-propeller repeat protein [Cyclobacteriaceae bacterium]|nr:PQQ-binding-like beta-propeller repeat protein [Cyclobacteriaceae bacterium]
MKSMICLIFFLMMAWPVKDFAQTPTRWRGPHQSGFYPETGLLKKWPEKGPQMQWHFDELGVGYSAPSFANNRIYISGMEGTMGYVYALTLEGKLLWKVPYGEEFTTSYPGSRSTPVIAGDHLYLLGGLGHLICVNAMSGVPVWKKHIFTDFDGRGIQWGLNETLVIDDDRLYCTPGGIKHNIIALNRFDGTLIWASPGKGEKSTYCTPLLTTVGNRKILVTHTEANILGINADDGAVLWNYGHTNTYNIHPNTPLFLNDAVFCFSGYGQGGVMLQMNGDGRSISRKWFLETMDSRIGGAVIQDGKIYGSGDRNREWQCIDWENGKILYTSTEIGNGVVITAEGLLYLYSQRGELALVRPGNSAFEIISETRVSLGSGQHWAHPVIQNGILYVRHGNALIAYNIRE